MKKTLLVLLFLVAQNWLMAQDQKNALGLRIGGNDGFGSEISYQLTIHRTNRIEADLGMHSGGYYSAWAATGLYQWIWNLSGNFNWYAGYGGKIGSWSNSQTHANDGIFLYASGVVGAEYNFPMGLQLGLDFRPELGILQRGEAYYNALAISARYRF